MNIEIQADGMTSSNEVQNFVNWRAGLALGPLTDRIDAVHVFVNRQQDAADGEEYRCLMRVKSGTLPDVIVEHAHSNLYLAIHRTVDEAGWDLARRFVREQQDFLDQQLEVIFRELPGAGSGNHLESHRAA